MLEESARQAASAASSRAGSSCTNCPGTCSSARPARARPPRCMNAGLTFPLAGKMGQASGQGRGRHAQLRLVVHRRRGDDRHRRALHLQQSDETVDAAPGSSFLSAAAQDAAAPPAQRRAAHREHPGSAAAKPGRPQGARTEAARCACRSCTTSWACARRCMCWSPSATSSPASTRASATWARKSATRSGASASPTTRAARTTRCSPSAASSPRSKSACATACSTAWRPRPTCCAAPPSLPSRSSSTGVKGLLGGFLEAGLRRRRQPGRAHACCAACTSPAAPRRARPSTACWARWRAPSVWMRRR